MNYRSAARVPAAGILRVMLTTSLVCSAAASAIATPRYLNPHLPLNVRVESLFKRLTLNDKLSLMTGTGFTSQPVASIGLPALGMVDGAQGVRGGDGGTQGPATAFPAGVNLASSWDPSLVKMVGRTIGLEALNKGEGAQVLLAPAINIQRSPLDGRNGEFFTEDPFLNAQLAVDYINGVQSTGCAACVKHYVCNNEEIDRGYVNVNVGERALREIYLPGFKAAVKRAHVWSIMAAYNKVNGQYCTDNWYLLTDILKDDWGFKGLAMSDWGAVHDTVGPVQAGLDLEMPGPGFLRRSNLKAALANGQIKIQHVDGAVKRLLRTVLKVGLLNHPHTPNQSFVNTAQARHLALRAADEGIVLLKNEHHVLPFSNSVTSIAVIGPRATTWHVGARGSVGVQPPFYINPLQAITQRAGSSVKVRYVQGVPAGDGDQPVPSIVLGRGGPGKWTNGLVGAYYNNPSLAGLPTATRIDDSLQMSFNGADMPRGVSSGGFSVRWQGLIAPPRTGRYLFTIRASGGYRLTINGKRVINRWLNTDGAAESGGISLIEGKQVAFRLTFRNDRGHGFMHFNWVPPAYPGQFADAVNAARKSSVAIVFVGSSDEWEGTDRPSMDLQGFQPALIRAIASANPNTVVVMNNGTPVRMVDWLGKVPAVVEAWFPGEEGSPALASILFGDTDPSGRLPVTLGAHRRDYPDFGNYPGTNGQVHYSEGIYVGYRWFDKKHIAPLFPFGYGLSYTHFKFSALHLSASHFSAHGSVTATVRVTNTGKRSGAEVVQLYLKDPHPKISRAVRELKGFQRLQLQPGETATARFTITARDFAYCDVSQKEWRAYPATYLVQVGASSRDIRLSTPLKLVSTYTRHIKGMGLKDPYLPKPSLATNKRVSASSIMHDNLPMYAVDGDPSTRWESQWSDPQWIDVDLGKPVPINRVTLSWEAAYGRVFDIQVSTDNLHWTSVYHTETGTGGLETISFPTAMARWVRMYGIKRGTQYGYSLYSFDVYGPGKRKG